MNFANFDISRFWNDSRVQIIAIGRSIDDAFFLDSIVSELSNEGRKVTGAEDLFIPDPDSY